MADVALRKDPPVSAEARAKALRRAIGNTSERKFYLTLAQRRVLRAHGITPPPTLEPPRIDP